MRAREHTRERQGEVEGREQRAQSTEARKQIAGSRQRAKNSRQQTADRRQQTAEGTDIPGVDHEVIDAVIIYFLSLAAIKVTNVRNSTQREILKA
jgi:hypothetical protein